MKSVAVAIVLCMALRQTPEDPASKWPDDAVLMLLDSVTEILRLAPWPHDSKAPLFVRTAVGEIGRRRLQVARPRLHALYAALPERIEPKMKYGENCVSCILEATLSQLEVATGDWDRILSQIVVPGIEKGCAPRKTPVLPSETFLAGAIVRRMVPNEKSRAKLRSTAITASPCIKRAIAVEFGVHLASATAEDRKVLGHFLTQLDEETQAYALRALLRGFDDGHRKKLALEYLESKSRTGELGTKLARRVLDARLYPGELQVEDARAEKYQERK
jgi:hypothetical protein